MLAACKTVARWTVALTGLLGTLGLARGADRSWVVVPGAFYSQETSLGFAAFGSVRFPLPNAGEQTWDSTVGGAVVTTLARQSSLTLWPSFYLGPANNQALSAELGLAHFPTRFYGLGPEVSGAWQPFTRRWFFAETLALQRVSPSLLVGLVHSLSVTAVRDVGEVRDAEGASAALGSAALGEGEVPGEAGGLVHGLGVALRQERRDNAQSTRQGTLLELRAWTAQPWLGSDDRFGVVTLDGRAFHTWTGDWTLAGQALLELRGGEVPFTHMAALGGDNLLRGLYEGRFRAPSLVALQGELRAPIFWRFRGVLFAGAGRVFGPAAELAGPPTWSAGAGLRFELDPAEHDSLRLDVGGGPDGFGLIFTFGEAF